MITLKATYSFDAEAQFFFQGFQVNGDRGHSMLFEVNDNVFFLHIKCAVGHTLGLYGQ